MPSLLSQIREWQLCAWTISVRNTVGIETTYYYTVEKNGQQTDVCEYKTQKTDTVKMLYVGDPQIGASKGQTQDGAELTNESGAENTAAENDGFSWNRTLNTALAPEEDDTDAQAALDTFHEDNNYYTIEDVDGNTVTDPQGILYMTANSASGSKYYELLSTQQDYVAARSQNWLPSYSVITMTADSFSIDTYQITDDGKTEAIDDIFTINKTAEK